MSKAAMNSAVTTLRKARVSSRPPVVFLHGLLGSPRSWEPVVDELDHKGALYAETIAGHGSSPRYHASFLSTLDAIADRWEDEPAHFVGYSLGARLALALAAFRPGSVLSVFSIGGHPGIADETDRLRRQRWETELSDLLVAEGLDAFVDHWEKLPMWDSQAAVSPELLHRQRRTRLSHTSAGLAWAMQTLGTGSMPELREPLQDTTIPITMVAGERDEKFAALCSDVATLSSSITSELIPDVGHNVVLESPSPLATLIRGHLVHSNLASALIPDDVHSRWRDNGRDNGRGNGPAERPPTDREP
jgi:2-succinyl-6-hydroxy-2,4-cyclohexadiene-1-carboxylate synthase